jgi:hypothetical protein
MYRKRKISSGGGDCYVVNGQEFMDMALLGNDSSLRLVHGEVTGQGPLEGVKYGHAWIEDGNMVLDFSNGRSIIMPKSKYYEIGQIGDNVHVYTPKQFQKRVLQYGHWGPWDLKTSTGL